MSRWFKGNLHTHTSGLGADGPGSPENVVRWYIDHGYDFLAITDHHVFTPVESTALVIVRGQEVGRSMASGEGPVHVNGFGISRTVDFVDAGEVVPTMQANVNAILEAGGIACLNHPNYRWGFNHEHIAQVNGPILMEVYNGGGSSKNNDGAPGRPSCEEIWDSVLTAGQQIYGIATDDAHTYDEFIPERANPGRGWVYVRAAELTEESILEALVAGHFYASTGVSLDALDVSPRSISLTIKPIGTDEFTTRFISDGGKVVSENRGLRQSYSVRGDEAYVRATILSSSGAKAWIQPVFL